MTLRRYARVVISTSVLLCSAYSARAEYPDRPVRIVAPFPAGGAADTLARILGDRLSQKLKQPFIVEDRPGSGSMTGSSFVAKSDADGYTLLMGSIANTTMFAVYTHVSYDLNRDLRPLCQITSVPNILVVGASSPYKTVQDIIADAKKSPGKLTGGSSGIGASPHLTLELFKHLTQTDILHVPYKGSPPGELDLIANRISMMFDNAALPQVKSGNLRALAVSTAKRTATLPDVPTLIESGIPGFDVSSWYGMWAPHGTPDKIVDLLIKNITELMAQPDIKEKVLQLGGDVEVKCGDKFQTLINSELIKWKKVAKDAQIKVN